MSFVNCPKSKPAIQAALGRLPGMAQSAARQGQFDASLLGDVQDLLTQLVSPIASREGAGAVSGAFDAYLPVAVAGAERRAAYRANASSSQVSALAGMGPDGSIPASAILTSASSQAYGSSWAGTSNDPGLRPSFGSGGSGSFFDPVRAAPGGAPTSTPQTSALGTSGVTAGSFSTSSTAGGTGAASSSTTADGAGVSPLTTGVAGATSTELAAFYSGASAPADDDTFWLQEWFAKGLNPRLMPAQVNTARRMYFGIVSPIAKHYKRIIFGSTSHPARLGKIAYGIMDPRDVRRSLRAGPTSRHLLGEAVNFVIVGVPTSRVIADLASGVIQGITVGTFAEVNGIHAGLPFEVEGQRIERLYLYQRPSANQYIGYKFT